MTTIVRTDTFARWLHKLRDRAAVQRIAIRIDRLALGNPGQVRSLKGGIREMKIDYGPGYRVYSTERAGEVVILLCGGDKSTQSADIAAAIALAADLE